MKKIYNVRPHRATFVVAAVAMTAITLSLLLVVPAKVEGASMLACAVAPSTDPNSSGGPR